MADQGRAAASDNLQELLSFAIEREQEAVDFYEGLAARVKTPAIASELLKIAAMEMQHRDQLKKLDTAMVSTLPRQKAADLKISDYMVPIAPSPDMSWQEVLRVAMQRETASMSLYTDLARLTEDPSARQLFEALAAAESSHKLYFERMWDEEVLLEN